MHFFVSTPYFAAVRMSMRIEPKNIEPPCSQKEGAYSTHKFRADLCYISFDVI